jgi:hypothetical protein
MKKTFVALLVSALAVWGYVIFRIIMVLLGGAESLAQTQVQGGLSGAALFARARAPLDTSFRDPFQSYLYAQKPAPVAAPPTVAKAAAVAVEPPKAVLSGILWGDEPVAILKQDGQTELVKKGAEIWDLKVLRIEKTRVMVLKQGRQFTLGY